MSFDVSKAFDTAPHGALAYLLRHMGVPKSIIALFQRLSCESSVRIVTAHGLTEPVVLRRGLRQGSAESAVLFALLLEPMLRELDAKSGGGGGQGRTVRALVQAYCDDIPLFAHDLSQFTKLAELVATYLWHMGMGLNVKKCQYSTTTHHTSVWLRLRPDLSHPWVSFYAASSVPYLTLSLLPLGGRTTRQPRPLYPWDGKLVLVVYGTRGSHPGGAFVSGRRGGTICSPVPVG